MEQRRIVGGIEGEVGVITVGPLAPAVKNSIVQLKPLALIIVERPVEQIDRVDNVDHQIANIGNDGEDGQQRGKIPEDTGRR
jgi:hypothetical protein